MIDVQVKTTDPETVAYIAMRGPFDQIPMAMGRLYGWVAQHHLEPVGMPSGVYLNNPELVPQDEALWMLRAPVAGDPEAEPPDDVGCGIEQVPPHLVAATMHRGPYDTIDHTYHELASWVSDHGYMVVGPPEELYYSDPDTTPPEEYLTEVRLTVAPN